MTKKQDKQTALEKKQDKLKKADKLVANISRGETAKDTLLNEVDKKVAHWREAYDDESFSEEELYDREQTMNKVLLKASGLMNLETHIHTSRTVREMYRPLVVDTTKKLIIEYQAESPSEIMLAQLAASAYGRYIEYTTQFVRHGQQDRISDTQNTFYSLFSKESDRAFRQFQSALSMLKQMKSPALNVTVKTNTAFVAQNQQVNATADNNKPHEYEINEAK